MLDNLAGVWFLVAILCLCVIMVIGGVCGQILCEAKQKCSKPSEAVEQNIHETRRSALSRETFPPSRNVTVSTIRQNLMSIQDRTHISNSSVSLVRQGFSTRQATPRQNNISAFNSRTAGLSSFSDASTHIPGDGPTPPVAAVTTELMVTRRTIPNNSIGLRSQSSRQTPDEHCITTVADVHVSRGHVHDDREDKPPSYEKICEGLPSYFEAVYIGLQ